jgi:hypothetical protein
MRISGDGIHIKKKMDVKSTSEDGTGNKVRDGSTSAVMVMTPGATMDEVETILHT